MKIEKSNMRQIKISLSKKSSNFEKAKILKLRKFELCMSKGFKTLKSFMNLKREN